MKTQFQEDVFEGLSSSPKFLSSKYFYDEIGDEIFVEIMHMPEYYLTDAEMEVFRDQKSRLAQVLSHDVPFELYELGSGDGTKTFHLLDALSSRDFMYRPIDISKHALESLTNDLSNKLPELKVEGIVSDYFKATPIIESSDAPKSVLFLGSNIGNMKDSLASSFIEMLGNTLKKGDRLLIGADLKKSIDIVLPAYNDAQGITARFNLNLLDRMNKELGADFDTDSFEHAPEYDEANGIARSFLKSKHDQTVSISSLNMSFEFKAGEMIHTETSRKYDRELIVSITQPHGLKLIEQVTDSRGYFCDFIFEKH